MRTGITALAATLASALTLLVRFIREREDYAQATSPEDHRIDVGFAAVSLGLWSLVWFQRRGFLELVPLTTFGYYSLKSLRELYHSAPVWRFDYGLHPTEH